MLQAPYRQYSLTRQMHKVQGVVRKFIAGCVIMIFRSHTHIFLETGVLCTIWWTDVDWWQCSMFHLVIFFWRLFRIELLFQANHHLIAQAQVCFAQCFAPIYFVVFFSPSQILATYLLANGSYPSSDSWAKAKCFPSPVVGFKLCYCCLNYFVAFQHFVYL